MQIIINFSLPIIFVFCFVFVCGILYINEKICKIIFLLLSCCFVQLLTFLFHLLQTMASFGNNNASFSGEASSSRTNDNESRHTKVLTLADELMKIAAEKEKIELERIVKLIRYNFIESIRCNINKQSVYVDLHRQLSLNECIKLESMQNIKLLSVPAVSNTAYLISWNIQPNGLITNANIESNSSILNTDASPKLVVNEHEEK